MTRGHARQGRRRASIALVGRSTGKVTKVMDEFDATTNNAAVTLEDAGGYERLTA